MILIRYRLTDRLERLTPSAHAGAGAPVGTGTPEAVRPATAPSGAPASTGTDAEVSASPAATVELIDADELAHLDIGNTDARRALRGAATDRFSYAESYADCIVGSIVAPHAQNPLEESSRFAFYLDSLHLVFADTGDTCRRALGRIEHGDLAEDPTPARMLYELLRYELRDDLKYLAHEDAWLEQREADIMSRKRHAVSGVLRRRRGYLRLSVFYTQLAACGDVIAQDVGELLTARDRRLFSSFSRQADRAQMQADALRDACMQLIDLHQMMADDRREKANLWLTVMASIAVPVTIVTGWYGMNFAHMPELAWPWAYPAVAVLCAGIVVAELIYFRHRKWL